MPVIVTRTLTQPFADTRISHFVTRTPTGVGQWDLGLELSAYSFQRSVFLSPPSGGTV